MRIALLDYVRGIQNHDVSLLAAILPFLASFLLLWLLTRVQVPLRELSRLAWGLTGLAAAVLGLMLTTVVYPCVVCAPLAEGCRVEVVGLPIPQNIHEVDPPAGWRDVCRKSWYDSCAATVANFASGALGLPLLVSLARRRRAAGSLGKG
jgi:hypothetical protein